jgi:transcriptional regulator with XRE-family HTH domain
MLTGSQMRMARGYLRWSVKELAEASGVSGTTIKRMEESDGVPKSIADNLIAIQRAFEAAGLEFIPENGGGAGVRTRLRRDGTREEH